ncbi:MAG: chondroitinase family polysaccharide lyase [Flavicella sp.]
MKVLVTVFLAMQFAIVNAQDLYAPAVESFESSKVLNFYNSENATLSISNEHRRFGQNSLKWEWNEKSSFSTTHFKSLSLDESPLAYGDHFPASPTLQMSVYSEIPQDGTIRISFENESGENVGFDIALNFKGWRRIWVPYYEMQGDTPQKLAMVDFETFKVSSNTEQGKLFFDDIIFSQFQDDRHQYPDEIVPFIKSNQKLSDDHWMPLISNYNRIKNIQAKAISTIEKNELKKIEAVLDQNMAIHKRYKVYINTLRKMYEKLGLDASGATVLGPPLTFKESQDFYDKKQQGERVHNDIRDLGKVMKKLASYHDRANVDEKKEIESMFLAGTKYYLDQGWQVGSSGGTRHHIGYNVREITEAFFVMRHFLSQHDLLDEVGASLHWLFNIGMLLDDPSTFHINIDYLNTQSYYHMMLAFMFEKQETQAHLLHAFSNYISLTLAQQNEEWGFKVDGSCWHHNGHYPAYGVGAYKSVPKVIKTLSGSSFRIDEAGHANFKKSFLTSSLFSQGFNWGFGNAGRHPIEDGGISFLKSQFLMMALSGNPEGTSKVDTDFASTYMRLWGKQDPLNTATFEKIYGVQKEEASGYFTLPYAATSVHRSNDWAAIIKGYSKYVWASEIYVNENRYGRYPANGTVQLLNSKGEKASGFRQEGWDWNRYPGGTIIHLPLKTLETKMPLLMFRSNETFAGSTKLGSNGVFGMVLNESKGGNADGAEVNIGFPGKLKAKKSVFSFGAKLICIGTGISSVDTEHTTETTLFQTFLKKPKLPVVVKGKDIKKFPYDKKLSSNSKSKNWLIDPQGNGYHILSDSEIHFKKSLQHSYHNKYSVNTGSMNSKGKGVKETQANYATSWISHGKAPNNASYQYVIYPFMDSDAQDNFGKQLKKEKSYTIIQADNNAHIVLDKESKTKGFVIFDADKPLSTKILNRVSEPSILMVQENDGSGSITISAVQPDLNFPEYKKGKFKNYSQEVRLEITLNGTWVAESKDFIKNVSSNNGKTIVSITCKDGLPREFNLSQKIN